MCSWQLKFKKLGILFRCGILEPQHSPGAKQDSLTDPTAAAADLRVVLLVVFVENGPPVDCLLEAQLGVFVYNHTTLQDL